jgi:branched-chain amino acid transport system substrate-binding protein
MTQPALTRRTALASGAAALAGSALIRPARAQGAPVRIGVLTDESSYAASAAGAGSIMAARMAAADFGPTLLGVPIEILHADTQNKADIASTAARTWFDQGVDAIVDMPATPVAAAGTQIAQEKNKFAMICGAASVEFTTKWCKPTTIMWQDDTHAEAAGAAIPAVRAGGKTWYFITVDFAFGISLEQQITQIVEAGGGKVLGSSRYPQNNADFSAQLLQAQASGAQVIGLCSVAGDLVNAIKQATEFGIQRKQQLTAFLVYITDIHALGPQTVQGLTFASSFYWNQSDSSRAFAKRFFAEQKAMPTREQAMVYASITQLLKSMAKAGTRETMAVRRAMSALPAEYFGNPTRVREDGRVLFDVTRYRVKAPADVHTPWDYYEAAGTLHPDEAFLPMEANCKFV